MKEREKLFTKTSFQKYLILHRDLFIYMRENVLLPTFFYYIVLIHIGLQSSLSVCYGMRKDIWPDENPFALVLRLITKIVKIGFIHETFSDILIEEVVSYTLLVIFLIVTNFCAFYFQKYRKLSRISLYSLCLVNDFLHPLLTSSFSTSVGYFIGLSIRGGTDIPLSFSITLTLVKIFLVVLYLFYANNFIYPQLSFYKGRTFTWNGSTYNTIRSGTDIILLLSALVESLNHGFIIKIIMILCFLISILGIFALYVRYPYFTNFFNIYHISLQITASIASFLIILINFHVKISYNIIILVWILGLGIILVLFNYLDKRRSKKLGIVLKLLSEKEIKIKDMYKSSSTFLRLLRYGFSKGDRYILSWHPFRKAVKLWPDQQVLWVAYIRCVAIYPEQNKVLMKVLNELKRLENKTFYTNNILKQVKIVKKARKRTMTCSDRIKMREIDSKIKKIKNLTITYWNSIIRNSYPCAFISAIQLHSIIAEVNSDFLNLINNRPNISIIAIKYSMFLNNILHDSTDAQFWENRGDSLRKYKDLIIDYNVNYALSAFPCLPERYDADMFHGESIANIGITTIPGTSTESFMKESVNSIDTTSDDIRNYGLRTSVGFIKNIYLVISLLFIFGFLLPSFIPSFIMLYCEKDVFVKGKPLEISSSLQSMLPYLNLMFVQNCLRNEGLIAPIKYEIELFEPLNDREKHIEEIIVNHILKINEFTELIQLYVNNVENITDELDAIFQKLLYKPTLFELLNQMVGEAFKYNGKELYLNKSWISNFQSNIIPVTSKLNDISNYLWGKLLNLIMKHVLYADICVKLSFVISIFIFIIYIRLISKIPKRLEYIIEVLNSLPQIGIHNLLTNYTIKLYEELDYSEKKYANIYNQMFNVKDKSNRLPFAYLFGIGPIYIIISGIFSVGIIYYLNIDAPKLKDPFYVKYFAAKLNYRMQLLGFGVALEKYLNMDLYALYIKNRHQALMIEDLDILSFITPIEMEKLLIGITTEINDSNNAFQRLLTYPKLMVLEVIEDLITLSYDRVYLNKTYDTNFLFLLNFLINEVYPNILEPIHNDKHVFSNGKLVKIIFSISAVLLLIGIILLTVLIINLRKIEITIKFVISSLSMIKPQYFKDNKYIMQLLSGDFTIKKIQTDLLSNSNHLVADLSQNIVIWLDKNKKLVFINKAAEKAFKISNDNYSKTDFSQLFEIKNVESFEKISHIAEADEIEKYASKEPVKIKILPNGKEFKFSIIVNKIHNCDDSCVIIMKDIKKERARNEELEDLRKKIESIRSSVIPKRLTIRNSFNKVFITMFEFVGFNELYYNKSSKHAFSHLNKFVNELEIHAKDYDALLVKRIGCRSIVIFNYLLHKSNLFTVSAEIIKFLKTFMTKYKYKVAITVDKNVVLANRSKTSLQFDIRSNKIGNLCDMLHSTSNGAISVDNHTIEFFPIEMSRRAIHKYYFQKGKPSSMRSVEANLMQ